MIQSAQLSRAFGASPAVFVETLLHGFEHATEMVWWVIFALLILVGRPVWTMLSVFVHR
jgi:hypothetical protein